MHLEDAYWHGPNFEMVRSALETWLGPAREEWVFYDTTTWSIITISCSLRCSRPPCLSTVDDLGAGGFSQVHATHSCLHLTHSSPHAGEATDTVTGRRNYCQGLKWLKLRTTRPRHAQQCTIIRGQAARDLRPAPESPFGDIPVFTTSNESSLKVLSILHSNHRPTSFSIHLFQQRERPYSSPSHQMPNQTQPDQSQAPGRLGASSLTRCANTRAHLEGPSYQTVYELSPALSRGKQQQQPGELGVAMVMIGCVTVSVCWNSVMCRRCG